MILSLTTLLLLSPLVLQEPEEVEPGPAVQDSSSCAMCHSNASTTMAMRDEQGRAIAPYDLWQGTLMANSARDPLWRAVVSAEVAALPSRRAEIEAECLRCHAPMAYQVGLDDHGTESLMHILDCDSQLGELARDGVSCTICHGISPDGLGTEASFSGNYALNGMRRLFGPHPEPFTMPMRMHTGFTPSYGAHVTDSALCGSCHTLETDAFDEHGNELGIRFLEQAPYLEWLNSDYATGPDAASCQSCHVPTHDDRGRPLRTRIARNPGGGDFPPIGERSPFGRHLFVGGNTLVLSMLHDHAEELRVEASAAALRQTIDATRRQLARAARVAVDGIRTEGRSIAFDVQVENLSEHKLPTAHPTRRAWLRVVVRDAEGAVLFASGATDARGRIVNATGEPLPSELASGPIEPHRSVVRSAYEVATYEAVMADEHGRPTHTLMRGTRWLIDDRLLPRGWSPEHEQAQRTQPVGVAADADFGAGGDRVRFELELSGEPASIEVALLYQSLSARWAAELLRWETPEVETFRRFYEQADLGPEVLASERWQR